MLGVWGLVLPQSPPLLTWQLGPQPDAPLDAARRKKSGTSTRDSRNRAPFAASSGAGLRDLMAGGLMAWKINNCPVGGTGHTQDTGADLQERRWSG